MRLLAHLIARWRLLILVPLIVGVLTAVAVVIESPVFQSGAAFAPEQDSKASALSSLSGLGAQLGIPLGGDATRSPEFYADVLRSRGVLEPILSEKVAGTTNPHDSVRVLSLYDVHGSTAELLRDNALKVLFEHIDVTVDRRTNIVRFTVEAPSATAARDVASRLLESLIRFNLYSRQSSARQRREFLQARVAEASRDLELAERAVRDFQEANRVVISADLRYREQQLARRVAEQTETYSVLRRAYETARVDEVNDTPPITVIERPEIPGLRVRPKRVFTVLSMMLITFLVTGLGIALLGRHSELVAARDPDYLLLLSSLPFARRESRRSRAEE